jgi:hypothetical protein
MVWDRRLDALLLDIAKSFAQCGRRVYHRPSKNTGAEPPHCAARGSEFVIERSHWRCTYREKSHGASHLTAIWNAPSPGDCSTRKTSPAPPSGRALGKQSVTSIFERIGISVSQRSRRPWALTFCVTVSTSGLSPVWNFTNADCRIGYLRSLRRSSRNMDRSPETGVHALRPPALTGFLLHAGSMHLGIFRSSTENRSADPLVQRRIAIRVQNNFHPVLSTKLCEQSGNMLRDLVPRNLQLRGNLIVRQADRDEAYQLLVSCGQLRCFLIIHIAPKNSPHHSVRESPLAGIVRRTRPRCRHRISASYRV